MKTFDSLFFVVPICAAAAAVLIFLLCCILKRFTNKKLVINIYVLALVWAFRFGVGLTGQFVTDSGESASGFNPFEVVIDSLIHALQTFSMDEDYSQFTLIGKRLLAEGGYPHWSAVYGTAASILNICAPILGGALLLDVLTGVFPFISLKLHPCRHKFVFSELNEEAVCLAEDILRDNNYQKLVKAGKFGFKPMIVFTDAYIDDKSESSSELYAKARKLGAVCVKRDLSNIILSKSKTVTYLLIDEKISDSLNSFSTLLKNDGKRSLWPLPKRMVRSFMIKCVIPQGVGIDKKRLYEDFKASVSYTDGDGNEVEINALGKYLRKAEIVTENIEGTPRKAAYLTFRLRDGAIDNAYPISVSADLSAITSKKVKCEVISPYEPATRIYIFVKNSLETEMAHNISSHSSNSRNILYRTINDYRNTSINLMAKTPLFMAPLKSGIVPESLNITIIGSGTIAKEVFKAIYWCGQIPNVKLCVNVLSNNSEYFRKIINEECPELFPCTRHDSPLLKIYPKSPKSAMSPPYIEKLLIKQVENAFYISDFPEDILSKTDYYIVTLGSDESNISFTDMLSLKLGRMRLENSCPENVMIVPAIYNSKFAEELRCDSNRAQGIHIRPFASLDERFSCRNVFMTAQNEEAASSEKLYNYANQTELKKDEYTVWANYVKVVHAPYKLFGAGLLEYDENRLYKFSGRLPVPQDTQNRLAWIEHRRWSAFLRSEGFVCPSSEQLERYFTKPSNHKNLRLKLHPCLVETQGEEYKQPLSLPGREGYDEKKYDCLDFVAIEVYTAKCRMKGVEPTAADLNESNFKNWDYIFFDKAIQNLINGS